VATVGNAILLVCAQYWSELTTSPALIEQIETQVSGLTEFL
jgi:hypothetical protein